MLTRTTLNEIGRRRDLTIQDSPLNSRPMALGASTCVNSERTLRGKSGR